MGLKLKPWFVICTLLVALVVIPVLFNVLFLWDSGLARGKISDWFVLYGNIFGGLIGGFFTYLSLVLTFKEQKENKKNEMKPRIDVPYQSIEFIDDEKHFFAPIVIELNNFGGSIAKNIQCKLSISNYEETINVLNQNKDKLKIDLIRASTRSLTSMEEKEIHSTALIVRDEQGEQKGSLGSVYKEYSAEFIGSCIPLTLNYEAKAQYILNSNVSNWINYIVRNRNYTYGGYTENELFNFNLDIKYSSEEYGDFQEHFKLELKFVGIVAENSEIKFQYILKSEKASSDIAA